MTYVIETPIEINDDHCEIVSVYRGNRLTATLGSRSVTLAVDAAARTARIVADTHHQLARPETLPEPILDHVLALGLRIDGPSVGQRAGFDEGYIVWTGDSQ